MRRAALCLAIALLPACAASVRSTVDGYGDQALARTEPLYFDRESLPLPDRPVSDSCREAARKLQLNVADQACPECRRVEVHARLAGTTQAIREIGPTFGTSFSVFGGSGFGMGLGTGSNVRSEDRAERVIEIAIFDGKKPLRMISARILGRENSVPAVAYEMCLAAFRDYPANVKGKEYAVKAGGQD